MEIKDTSIFIPSGELPKTIQIGDRSYNTRQLIEIIERITGKHIISKRQNKALRNYRNTTIRLGVILNTNSWDALKIIGRKHIYLLTPQFKRKSG